MIRILIIYSISFLFVFTNTNAQVFVSSQDGICVNNRATLFIAPTATLHVDGNFYNKKSEGPLWVRSNGIISLTGNLNCASPLICERASSTTPTSQFIFSPKTPTVTVIGNDSLVLYHTIINKLNTIIQINSGTTISVLDTLDFQGGNFFLNGGHIHMNYPSGTSSYINHPYLKNENHHSRIFGDSGYVSTQAIATLSNGIAPSSHQYNFANLGLTLTANNADSITIHRGHTKQFYAGNGSIAKYYDVLSNHDLTDSVNIHYMDSADYNGLGINKHTLKAFASPGSDIDYVKLQSTHFLASHTATASIDTFPLTPINPKFFRITLADEQCVNPPISALPNGTIHICSGQTHTLDAGNHTSIPNSSLKWNWSNTSAITQTIAVVSSALVQQVIVTITDVRGCSIKDTITIAPTASIPSANFSTYHACFGDSIKLISMSTGSISNYTWAFGDGTFINTSVNDTIKKAFNTAGHYPVKLTVTSNEGCISSKVDSVWSFPLPTASIANQFNCITKQMDFTSTSSAGFGIIQTNYWNFNTAISNSFSAYSATATPSYSYATGTYTVKLLVKTYYGCKDSVTKAIVVIPQNVSSFFVSNTCLGDTVNFTNTSSCYTGSCHYVWDFGDGTQSTLFNPKKMYATSGVYNVTLKTINGLSCMDSVSVPVIIHPKPLVNFSNTPVCLGNVSYFINNSSITTGSIVSYNWNLGNGSTSTNTNTSFTYTNAGNYVITLSASSDKGCVASMIKNNTVFQKPTAQYAVSNVCLGQPSIFNQNSIGSSLNYLWAFESLASSTIANPHYTYSSPGTYNSSLIVTDINGCTDTSSVNTAVYNNPHPALGGTITTCGTSYTLNAGSGSSYFWSPLNATSQSITVTTNGNHTVTVTDSNGCVGQDAVKIELNTPVKPHLGNDTISCGPYLINAGYPGSTFLWNTGSTAQTLLATTPSTYIVTITDMNGCVGKDTVAVLINPLPSLSLGADITQCQTNQAIVLSPTTTATSYSWSNGTTQSSLNATTGGYYALTVTDNNGCKTSDTISVNVLPSPVVNLGIDSSFCGFKLLDAQNNGATYLWSNGSNTQTLNAVTNGTYWVEVTHPTNGCSSTDSINLNISTPINLFLGNDTSTCSNSSFVLNAGNVGSSYHWSTGATTQTISTGSSGTYGVTVTNGLCTELDAITISVLTTPSIDLGNAIHYLCGNGFVTLDAGNTGSVSWGSNNGFSSSQSIVTLYQPGNYWAVVSNGMCSSSDTVNIIQTGQSLQAYFIASTVDTVGKAVKFVDVSEPTPNSWLWNFGDGSTSTNQSPEHVFLTPQAYNVSLTVSNGFCSSQITKSLQVFKLIPSAPKEQVVTLNLVNFLVFPNPANQYVNILFELNDEAHIAFNITDITGKVVYEQAPNQSSIFNEEIDATELTNGIYVINIIAENRKGFVKQNSKLIIVK